MRQLEVRIPISPRADYFNRVRLIALSIREFYADAVFQISVGPEIEPYDLRAALPWSNDLGIEWKWVPRHAFDSWRETAHPYIATMMQRFEAPFNAEYVLMLDADVMPFRRFDELFLIRESVAGVMAYASPFFNETREAWFELFSDYGLGSPKLEQEISGWEIFADDPRQRLSPPYFNTGVLFARAELLAALHPHYIEALMYVRGKMDTYFFEQIALTLALERASIPARVLSVRYNYPNYPPFDKLKPAEFDDLRFLHFLRTEIIDRAREFASPQAVSMFLGREDLSGSNEAFRLRVGRLAAKFAVGELCA